VLENINCDTYTCDLCTVEGTKQSQVEAKLMKDGKALPLKDVEIVVGEDKITYKIKKPQRELSGIYQIKISNNQGEEMKDVNIVMQGLCCFYKNYLKQISRPSILLDYFSLRRSVCAVRRRRQRDLPKLLRCVVQTVEGRRRCAYYKIRHRTSRSQSEGSMGQRGRGHVGPEVCLQSHGSRCEEGIQIPHTGCK